MKGEGNSYDFDARIYDSRIGRWLSLDPLASKYPGLSPYNFAVNSPILFIDPNGKEAVVTVDKNEDGGGTIVIKATIYLTGVNANETKASIMNKRFSDYAQDRTVNVNGESWTVKFEVNYEYKSDISESDLAKGENILSGENNVKRSHIHSVNMRPQGTQEDGDNVKVVRAFKAGKTDEIDRLNMGSYGKNTTMIHETFHMLGLGDRYKDVEGKGSVTDDGWEGDIMGDMFGNGFDGKPSLSDTHIKNYVKTFSNLESGDYLLNFLIDSQLKGNFNQKEHKNEIKYEKTEGEYVPDEI